MTTKLEQFIIDTLYIAGLRNVDPVNPVTLGRYSPDRKKYLVTVGYLEPSFSQLPYNLLWVPYDKDHIMYGKVLRRTSNQPSEGYKYTWEIIQDYDDLWSKEQYYENVTEVSTIVTGQDWSGVTEATFIKSGTVILKEPQSQQKVIHTDDSRLTDTRVPTAHDHPDYPRTMVHIKGEYSEDEGYADYVGDTEDFLKIISAKHPVKGEVFFLLGYDVNRPNMWYGEWRKPSTRDIEWLVPKLESLDITLPGGATTVTDNTSTDLGAYATYNTGEVTIEPPLVRWSVSANDLGVSINATTGMLFVPDIDGQAVVTVTAELTDPNDATNIVTGTLEITLDDTYEAPTVTDFHIEGPITAESDSDIQLTFIATLSDGTENQVRATTSGVNKGASITEEGLLTIPAISEDTTFTVTATYNIDGEIHTDEHEVLVSYVREAGNLVITGQQAVNENSQHTYVVTLNYTDGTSEVVTPSEFITDNPLASASNLEVSYGDVTLDTVVELTAKYTYLGELLTATLPVTVGADLLQLTGAAYMDEGETESYVVTLLHSDGTSEVVTPTSFNADVAGLTITGLDVTATDVNGNSSAVLTATYNTRSEVLTATLDVNFGVSTLSVTGPSTINEGDTATYVLTLTDGKGVKTLVQPESVTSDINSLTFVGLVASLGNILDDTTANVEFTYMLGTSELKANIKVNLKADILEIQGPANLVGGESETYSVVLKKAAGGQEVVSPDTFTTSLASLTLEGLVLTAPEDVTDGDTILTATYNDGAGVMTATLNVSVTEGFRYTHATVEGPASFPIEVSQTYQVRLHDNQGGSKLVSMTNPTIVSDSPKASFLDADSVRVDAEGLTNNYVFTFTGQGTWEGTTLTTAEFTATALYIAPELVSLVLSGDTTLDTGTVPVVGNYTVKAIYDDGSEEEVSPTSLTWSKPDLATSDATAKTLTVTDKVYTTETGTLIAKGIAGNPSITSNALTVTLRAAENPVTTMKVLGPDSVIEGDSGQYQLEVTYESGATKILGSEAEYVLTSGGTYLTTKVETSDGKYNITVGDLIQDRVATLRGSTAGTTATSTKTITLVNLAADPVIVSLAIQGPAQVDENSTTRYGFVATYDNGVTETVVPRSVGTDEFTFSLAGDLVTTNLIGGDVTANLTADYLTPEGTVVNATLPVLVSDSEDKAVSLTVTIESEVPNPYLYGDSTTVQLKATLVKESGATEDITNTGFWELKNLPDARASITSKGVFSVSAENNNTTSVTVVCYEGPGKEGNSDSVNITVTRRPKQVVNLYITGPNEVTSGSTDNSYILHRVYDDSTEDTVSVSSWTVTQGSMSSNTLNAPEVTTDTGITISASYTGYDADYAVTVKAADVGYAPRFGSIDRIHSQADFNEAFAESLTRPLTGTDGEIMQVQPFDSEYGKDTYVYLMYPAELGFIYAEQLDDSGNVEYTGGIDGAKNWDDSTFDFTGAALATIKGIDYYIYRNDFSYENLDPEFRLTYGSGSTMSGNR